MSLFCQVSSELKTNPAGNYMFKVNKRNTRAKSEICWKVSFGVFIVNFKHISHLVIVFLLFEQVIAGWLGSFNACN